MRLVTYSRPGDEPRPGLLLGERVLDTRSLATRLGWDADTVAGLTSNRRVLELGGERLAQLAERVAAGAGGEGESRLADVHLGPPVPDPEKIICLGLNYIDHAAETKIEPPREPMFFCKFANSLIGPADEIVPPRVTEQVDYEGELAVVIGSVAHDVGVDEALSHVAGAMVLNDVSARDLQLSNPLWTGGKAIDTFAPCGPSLVTLDELGDLDRLQIRTWVNGELVQDAAAGTMIFGPAETIAFVSRVMTLVPGDIISTGTPPGVGLARTPQLFLDEGDSVEVEIDRIGRLANRVAAPR